MGRLQPCTLARGLAWRGCLGRALCQSWSGTPARVGLRRARRGDGADLVQGIFSGEPSQIVWSSSSRVVEQGQRGEDVCEQVARVGVVAHDLDGRRPVLLIAPGARDPEYACRVRALHIRTQAYGEPSVGVLQLSDAQGMCELPVGVGVAETARGDDHAGLWGEGTRGHERPGVVAVGPHECCWCEVAAGPTRTDSQGAADVYVAVLSECCEPARRAYVVRVQEYPREATVLFAVANVEEAAAAVSIRRYCWAWSISPGCGPLIVIVPGARRPRACSWR